MRENFTLKTINHLGRRAGYRCSNPNCRKLTVGANENKEKSTLLGVAAHITAASGGGPRYDDRLSSKERVSMDNAIWLCSNCATLIDKDPKRYTVELLKQWKEKIDEETTSELEKIKEVKEIKVSKKGSFEEMIEEAKKKSVQKRQLTAYLNSTQVLEDANNEAQKVIELVKEYRNSIHNLPEFHIVEKYNELYAYDFGHLKFHCLFRFIGSQNHKLEDKVLEVVFYRWSGIFPFDYKEKLVKKYEYHFTRNTEGSNGWSNGQNENFFIETQELAQKHFQEFMEYNTS